MAVERNMNSGPHNYNPPSILYISTTEPVMSGADLRDVNGSRSIRV